MAVITAVVTKPVVDSVTMKLSAEEARTLHVLLARITGDPKTTPRGLCDVMHRQLGSRLGDPAEHPESSGVSGTCGWGRPQTWHTSGDTVTFNSTVEIS